MGCTRRRYKPSLATSTSALLMAATLVLAGCGQHGGQGSKAPRPNEHARQVKASDMSPAERKYGMAPVPDPSVTYKPDVILVGGGAEAIRDFSANGLIWTIDGSAPHASELAAGKVFFMTGRAVGRVLDVRKDGSNLVI